MKTKEELKTLKDMYICLDCTLEGYHTHIKELKAEAAKWVKEIQGTMFDDELHYSTKWIKHFFNLTEEDLI